MYAEVLQTYKTITRFPKDKWSKVMITSRRNRYCSNQDALIVFNVIDKKITFYKAVLYRFWKNRLIEVADNTANQVRNNKNIHSAGTSTMNPNLLIIQKKYKYLSLNIKSYKVN